MKIFIRLIKFSVATFLVATLFLSCKNDLDSIIKLGHYDSIPNLSIENINLRETQNGKLSMILEGEKMISYQDKNPYTEFPQGFNITFFDSLQNKESEIRGNYGISWAEKQLMQAKGNVHIYNHKKKLTLNTENIFWDQKQKKIYTDDFVKITEPDRIILGKGMESDEIFNNWIIKNVTGTIYLNDSN